MTGPLTVEGGGEAISSEDEPASRSLVVVEVDHTHRGGGYHDAFRHRGRPESV